MGARPLSRPGPGGQEFCPQGCAVVSDNRFLVRTIDVKVRVAGSQRLAELESSFIPWTPQMVTVAEPSPSQEPCPCGCPVLIWEASSTGKDLTLRTALLAQAQALTYTLARAPSSRGAPVVENLK